jgi:hypothetical protein
MTTGEDRPLVNRPGSGGGFGVSWVPRRPDFWILVSDTRRMKDPARRLISLTERRLPTRGLAKAVVAHRQQPRGGVVRDRDHALAVALRA